ncbi:eCIS core domain-containing protein [Georgenia yuyongxinii]
MSVTHAHHSTRTTARPAAATDQAEQSAPAGPAPLAGLLAPPLVVGAAQDRAEHDADALADRALRRLHAAGTPASEPEAGTEPHRHDPSCGHLRRAGAPAPAAGAIGAEGGAVDPGTAAVIEGRRGAGRPLPGPVRRQMEGAFGAGLGHVRVHDDAQAAGLSRRVSARAFTTGSDIFFGAGEFAPGTADGERVLAHELAHVVSEPGPRVQRLFGFGKKLTPEEQAEKDRKKQEKAKAKEDEARRRAEATEQKKQAKADAAANRKLEKSERAHLKASRAEGVAGRKALNEDVYSGPGSGTKMQELNVLFEDALRYERFQLDELAAEHTGDPEWTDARIADEAYRLTWLEGSFAERLKPVRPPRETAAERLVIDVRQARTAASVRVSMNEAAKRGTLLPEDVENKYEEYVLAVDLALRDIPDLDLETAEARAEALVWATAPAKVRKARPARGSALDKAAVREARARVPLQARTAPPPILEGAEQTQADVGKVTGKVGTALTVGGLANNAYGAIANQVDKKPDTEETENVKKASFWDKLSGKATKPDPEPEDPRITQTVKKGIGSVLSIFGSLRTTVEQAMKFAVSVQRTYEDPRPRPALAAAKAGADGLNALVAGARSTAQLAATISPAVSGAVAQVVPGLNIAAAALNIVSSAVDLAGDAVRVHETNQAFLGARSRTPGATKVDVLVYPMLKVAQRYAKKLENSTWSTVNAIRKLATSIATVASAGGYGIPAAVDAGFTVVDLLHKFGHLVADEVLVRMAKIAEQESAVQHLEGGAENELRRHPAMAVDGIIMRAARGDEVAMAFLSNYDIDGMRITPAMLTGLNVADRSSPDPSGVGKEDMLFKLRNAVLVELGEDADPQQFYEKWQAKASGVVGMVTGAGKKWGAVGQMADKRNRMDQSATGGAKGRRGLGWKLKMMLKTGDGFTRSQRKTEVNWDDATGGVDSKGAAIVCGKHVLPHDPTDEQLSTFLQALEAMPAEQILKQTANPANSEVAKEFLLNVWSERMKQEEMAGAGV